MATEYDPGTPAARCKYRRLSSNESEVVAKFAALTDEERTQIRELFGSRDSRAREIVECRILHNPDRTLESLGEQFDVKAERIRVQQNNVLHQLDDFLLQREYALLRDTPEQVSVLSIRSLGLSNRGCQILQRLGYVTVGDLKPLQGSRYICPALGKDDQEIFRTKMTELGYMQYPVRVHQMPEQDPYNGPRQQVLDREISRFPLSVRARRAVSRKSCMTVRDFLAVSSSDFRSLAGIGDTTQMELDAFRQQVLSIPE